MPTSETESAISASENANPSLPELPITKKRAEAIALTEKELAFLIEDIANHESNLRTGRPQFRTYHNKALIDAKVRLGSLTALLRDLKQPPKTKGKPTPTVGRSYDAKNMDITQGNSATTMKNSDALSGATNTTIKDGARDIEPQLFIFPTEKLKATRDLLEANRLGHLIVVNQDAFFDLFFADLDMATKSVEIVCAFVKSSRTDVLEKLAALHKNGVNCLIYTSPPKKPEERDYIADAKEKGINIVLRDYIHYKVAIIDNLIVWQGSLNILSHQKSRDAMTRHVGRGFCDAQRKILDLPSPAG